MTNLAKTRYNWRVAGALVIYVPLILGIALIFSKWHISAPLNYVLAALPAFPVMAMITFFGIYLAEEKDDFQRTILVTSSLWATGVVLALATFWGFIESYTTVVQVPMYWAFVLWNLVLGVVQPILRRQYR